MPYAKMNNHKIVVRVTVLTLHLWAFYKILLNKLLQTFRTLIQKGTPNIDGVILTRILRIKQGEYAS